MLTPEEYTELTVQLIRSHTHDNESRCNARNSEDYFLGHLPRFLEQKRLVDEYIHLDKSSKVLDCGTFFPFVSWYLNQCYGCTVHFTCLQVDCDRIGESIFGWNSNIIFLDYGTNEYDVIFLTEILEHLTCNLYPVRDKMIRAVKPGGYLLVSYPTKGANAQDYDKDLPGDVTISHGEHIREFTRETAAVFIPLPVVEKHTVYTQLYGGLIYQFLYRKEAK